MKLNEAAKSMQNPQQQLSSLDIYHTLCLSAIAIFLQPRNFVPSDIHSLLFISALRTHKQHCPRLLHSNSTDA